MHMKRKVLASLTLTFMAMAVVGIWGCSKDDSTEENLGTEDNPGIVSSPVFVKNSDITDFFNEALPNDGERSECFFASPTGPDKDTCCVVNSRSELQALYTCDKQLPEIDFDKYTLILGMRIIPAGYAMEIKTVETTEEAIVVTLETEQLPGAFIAAMIPYYYWGLYEKLSPQKVITKVIRKN